MAYSLEYFSENFALYYEMFFKHSDVVFIDFLHAAEHYKEYNIPYSLFLYRECHKQYRKYAIREGVISPKKHKNKNQLELI